ncbi:MAG: addiction module protein [Rhodocyclaceae bacterium]|nr:addiction module protein [Rhodocyclaceae bacterium]
MIKDVVFNEESGRVRVICDRDRRRRPVDHRTRQRGSVNRLLRRTVQDVPLGGHPCEIEIEGRKTGDRPRFSHPTAVSPAPTFVSILRQGYKGLVFGRHTMHMTVEQITDEALALPSEARALLADRLVESLDPAEDGYIRQLWMRKARRRIDEVRSGEVKTIPADEAFAEIRRAIAR